VTDKQLAVREAQAIAQRGFDDPTVELIRKSVSNPRDPLTTDEFDLFLAVWRHTGLNPLLKEIYALKSGGRFSIVPGVDGYRRKAQQSPRFRGMAGPLWCGPDGIWVDAWLGDGPPAACKVGVYLPGQSEPTWAVAYYKNYRDRRTPTWQAMPEHMLAVRAEVHALRKCFSRELAGMAMPSDDDAGYQDAARQVDEDTGEIHDGTVEPPRADELRGQLEYARREGKETEAASLEQDVKDAESREARRRWLHQQAKETYGELTERGVEVRPPAKATTEALTVWLEEWGPRLVEARRAQAEPAAPAEEIEPDDLWEEIKRQPPAEEAEQPALLGDDGVVSPLWPQVQATAAEADAAGMAYTMPPATQSEDFHRDWIARTTRAIRAKQTVKGR
jgi:phage recombination protein Bet